MIRFYGPQAAFWNTELCHARHANWCVNASADATAGEEGVKCTNTLHGCECSQSAACTRPCLLVWQSGFAACGPAKRSNEEEAHDQTRTIRSIALAAITATTAKSGPVLAQTSADRPGFFAAKDIAEAGFIYGLPIVMNYGVMYEYAVDRNSGQFKAPFNQIKNEPNVFTYKDTADRHPEQRHAVFVRVDGPAGGADYRPFGPGGGPEALLTRSCSATAIPTTTAISAAVPPEARPAITWLSGRSGSEEFRPGSKGVPAFEHTIFGVQDHWPYPAFQPGRSRRCQEGPGRLQGPDAFQLPGARRPSRSR